MDAAAIFRTAVAGLQAGLQQQQQARAEVDFETQPPPRKLAPFAAAVGATVYAPEPGARVICRTRTTRSAGAASSCSTTRPGKTGWDGPFRIIAYVRADLEPEIAADPLIGQVGWSWLTEALDARAAGYRLPSGTVTRVVTEGFGAKQDEPMATGFELRASWSPADPAAVRPRDAPGARPPARLTSPSRSWRARRRLVRRALHGGGPAAACPPE